MLQQTTHAPKPAAAFVVSRLQEVFVGQLVPIQYVSYFKVRRSALSQPQK